MRKENPVIQFLTMFVNPFNFSLASNICEQIVGAPVGEMVIVRVCWRCAVHRWTNKHDEENSEKALFTL